jgi:aspartokinase/homoserine dehydrogenase 1
MTEPWFRILQQYYPIDIRENESVLPMKSKDRLVVKEKGPHPKRSAWNVHKFGGSSFENADSYSFVASLINSFEGKNLIVVSALSGITNQLYSVCRRAKLSDWQQSEEWIQLITRISSTIKGRLGDSLSGLKETQRFAVDLLYLTKVLSRMSTSSFEDQESIEQMVVGYGEIWSARLMTQTMRDDLHRAAAYLDARDVLVIDQNGLKIDVCWEITKEKLKKWFYKCRSCDILIVTGFIARNLQDMPVTLKRNGSDFSATIFSVLTKANSVTIWKDVDGMYTADPKKYPDAKFIPQQTFEEAEEASRRGAFVIQADCIEPAKLFNIPIFLRNCFHLDCPGTRIGSPVLATNNIDPSSDATLSLLEKVIQPPVDVLIESIQHIEPAIYPLTCSDPEAVPITADDQHQILEIIV